MEQKVVIDNRINGKAIVYSKEKDILENLTPDERSLWAVWATIASIDGDRQQLLYTKEKRRVYFVQYDKHAIEEEF